MAVETVCRVLSGEHRLEYFPHLASPVQSSTYHGEHLLPLQIAIEAVVDAVGADYVVGVANGHYVDTLSGDEGDVPVVFRHSGNHVVVIEPPSAAHMAVLNPEVGVLRLYLYIHAGVLHEDGGMGLMTVMANLALVVDDVLHGKGGAYHLAGGSIVIELAFGQRQYGYGKLAQVGLVDEWMGAYGAAKLRVEVVLAKPSLAVLGMAGKQTHGAVAEQPHADVGEIVVGLQQVVECFHRRFLQHLLQHRRRGAVGDKHAVVAGYGRVEPESVADNVG